MEAFKQLQLNHGRNEFYEAETAEVRVSKQSSVKVLAFYLPQFHPIPENDTWWGRGFTEWTNVAKAIPRFPGHYQPHLPSDLGFYDLRLAETLRSQAELAKRYGLSGFCFHWYWFAGKRLLETPLHTLLKNSDIDLPFFINWANENWTRRWDGQDKTVLMAQKYSVEDDLALADAFLELMKDRRYIRVDGRPLVMLYRPSLLPDAAATVKRWRDRFAEKGEANPFVLMAQGFDDVDPRPYGIDAAVQYPPHNMGPGIERINDLYQVYDNSFSGNIFSFDALIDRMMSIEDPPFKCFRGVCPGWDNEARRPNGGSLFVNSTPRKYGRWLAETCQRTFETQPPSERLVFVNAWNEWAEGAHLEPDRHYGHAYLRETLRAVDAVGSREAIESFIAERAVDTSEGLPSASKLKRFLVKAHRKVARTLNDYRKVD